MNNYIKYEDSIKVLTESENPSYKEINKIISVLDDCYSPLNRGYIKLMMESIESKMTVNINEADIHKSKGDVDSFSGTLVMEATCNEIKNLAQKNRFSYVIDACDTVLMTIQNLRQCRDLYQKGYNVSSNYVITEYSSILVAAIETTSCILDSFVEYVESGIIIVPRPKSGRNSTVNKFINDLNKLNKVFADPQNSHRKLLEAMVTADKDNFIGSSTTLGIAAVSAAAIAVIPITRELVYQFYKIKSNLSDCCAQQAYFLELNKSAVENNVAFDSKKKAEILKKQENVKNTLLKLSSKLRVDHVKAISQSKQMLQKDNKMMTLDNIQQEVNQSPLQLF